jgi:porphobilinogen synthase
MDIAGSSLTAASRWTRRLLGHRDLGLFDQICVEPVRSVPERGRIDTQGRPQSISNELKNGREALRESLTDKTEGADMLMVRPALPYLDIVANVRAHSRLPLAAYQVSGEYAMIKFAAIDKKAVVREFLDAIKRAGADLILTYFAMDFARDAR